MSQHFVTRRGVRLAYHRRGAGQPVVLIQGLGLPAAMWLGLTGGLVKSGHLVVSPDNRGTGASDAPRVPYCMAGLAADTAAVMDHAGVERALVVGLSLGGMIAQRLCLDHPRLVGGMVLAATTCGVPLGRPVRLRVVLEMLRALSGSRESVRRIRRLLVHPDTLARDPNLFSVWDRTMSAAAPRMAGVLGQMAAAASHSTCLRLKQIACPVEVITGDSDVIVPPANSRTLARRIPDARLTLVPRAGHAFPLEDPAALPLAIGRVRRLMKTP